MAWSFMEHKLPNHKLAAYIISQNIYHNLIIWINRWTIDLQRREKGLYQEFIYLETRF